MKWFSRFRAKPSPAVLDDSLFAAGDRLALAKAVADVLLTASDAVTEVLATASDALRFTESLVDLVELGEPIEPAEIARIRQRSRATRARFAAEHARIVAQLQELTRG